MTRPSGSSDFPRHKFQIWVCGMWSPRQSLTQQGYTLSISLDGDQSKQEDSVKRRINKSDRKFCINEGGGEGDLFYELLMELYFS